MRWLVALCLIACHGSTTGNPMFPDAAADGAQCAPSAECTDGPKCGLTCCGVGEQCVNGACKCGSNPPCNTAQTGNTCQSGGATMMACGFVCCGGSGGSPCPI